MVSFRAELICKLKHHLQHAQSLLLMLLHHVLAVADAYAAPQTFYGIFGVFMTPALPAAAVLSSFSYGTSNKHGLLRKNPDLPSLTHIVEVHQW